MNVFEGPRGCMGLYESLLRSSPKVRIASGLVAVLGGAALSVVLWNRGVILGAALFAWVAGIFLTLSGVASQRVQARRRAQLEVLARQKDDIVEGMIGAQRSGKSPVRWLNEQGILDAEIRGAFLEHLNERLKAEGAGKEPGADPRPPAPWQN